MKLSFNTPSRMTRMIPHCIVIALGAVFAGPVCRFAASLYEQSLAARIAARSPRSGVAYLLLDARTGQLLGKRWDSPHQPIPVGSLVKPFTALAYAESHNFTYPVYLCRASVDGCWLPRGHGRVGIELAIGNSCNAYFRQLAREVRLEDVKRVRGRFGIEDGPDQGVGRDLVGLGAGWPVAPVSIVRAYCELAARSGDPGVSELIHGMALSARSGTGRALDHAVPGAVVLVKTGTAPCIHQPRSPGDGYAIVLWPADSPRFALLVGVHGVPGAQAAAVCGRILRAAGD